MNKEEFEYGELVEVRDFNGHEWVKRRYVGTMPNCKQHWTMGSWQDTTNFDGFAFRWNQIRKIEPGLTDIGEQETLEQRLDNFEAILNGAIAHINAQIQSIKEQLK